MSIRLFLSLLICMCVADGCSSNRRPATVTRAGTQVVASPAQHIGETGQEKSPQLVKVERFVIMKDSLRLDYRVTNVFAHDIWVCTSLDYGRGANPQDSVETRIMDKTLRIRRRANLEQNIFIQARADYAVYHRVAPGQSRSDTILLSLPVWNVSPVYMEEHPFSPKQPVVLNRVVFELGYFGEDLPTLLSRDKERGSVSLGSRLKILEEDPNIALVRYVIPNRWEGLDVERSATVTIADLEVPGMLGGILRRGGLSGESE